MLRLCLFVSLAIAATTAFPSWTFDGRIVNGEDASIYDFPWQISLQIYDEHMCGGSIISDTWIVTAAHCTDGLSERGLSIRAGSTYKSSGGQVRKIAEIHQHPEYDEHTFNNDISLLKLESPLPFGTGIQKIDLPTAWDDVKTDSHCVCSGWGDLKENGEEPEHLQSVELQILDHEVCKEKYATYKKITDEMICTHDGTGKDSCQGDSGGPLAQDGILIGVVSWGRGCARPNNPGVYSNVSYLRTFIRRIVGF